MSYDERTEPTPLSPTASDRTDPEAERVLADRLRRAAAEAAAERTVKDFDTEPTRTTPPNDDANTSPDAGEGTDPSASSMENAPELAAALAQFSGRALQEAKFQAASDGRGAARYDVVAVPAKSLGGDVQPHGAEVIIATTPIAHAAAVATPDALVEASQGGAEPVAQVQAIPGAHPRIEGTTIPGLRRRGSGGARTLAIVLIVLTVLIALGVAYLFGFAKSAPRAASTTSPTAQSTERAPEPSAPVLGAAAPASVAPATPAPSSIPSIAPTNVPLLSPTGASPPVVAASHSPAPPISTTARPGGSTARPAAPTAVTPSDPKREPPAKSDFVW